MAIPDSLQNSLDKKFRNFRKQERGFALVKKRYLELKFQFETKISYDLVKEKDLKFWGLIQCQELIITPVSP